MEYHGSKYSSNCYYTENHWHNYNDVFSGKFYFLPLCNTFGGFPIILNDTAGLRKTSSKVEKIGINRALNRAEKSDLILICPIYAAGEKKDLKFKITDIVPGIEVTTEIWDGIGEMKIKKFNSIWQ